MIISKCLKRLVAVTTVIAIMSFAIPQISFANEEVFEDKDRVVHYARQTGIGKSQAWDRNMPYPLDKTSSSVGSAINAINDGSSEYPAESHLALSEISGGRVVVMYDFALDRRMDDTAFRLIGKKKTIFGIVTKGKGLYLEQIGGKDLYLCSYTPGSTASQPRYVVRAELDFDAKLIKSVQINGKTYAKDKPFASNATIADGFDIRTGEKAIGVVSNWCLFIDGGYIIDENFLTGSGTVSDSWNIESNGGSVVLSELNNALSDRFYMTMDTLNGGVSATRKVDPIGGKITFETNLLMDEKRGGFEVSSLGGGKSFINLSSNGNSFCYTDENGKAVPFYNFIKNIWYNLKVKIDFNAKTYDLYLNNRLILSGIKFAQNCSYVDAVRISSEKNDTLLHIDDVLMYKTPVYPDDYPVVKDIPEKKENAPLVGMQFCPMWVEGTHFGWDFIAQSSDRRQPVIGFYDGNSPEAADWIIKQLVEHGVDYLSVCTFPHNTGVNDSDLVSQITDINVRSAGFLSAVLDSRYSDLIKYSIFLEANGITEGKSYYDDFFEVVWPHYIEHYFKDPRYLKVDGRPVFGVYSAANLFNVFDDGTGKESIRRGVEKMRQMCIDAGVGNPYLIVNNGNYQISLTVNAGFDAVSSYGFNQDSTFTLQKEYLKEALESCQANGIDFIPSAVPMRDDTGWRIDAGYWHTGEEFEQFLNWMNDDLIKDYKPSVGSVLANMCTWDEYGEGHIVAPTVGMGFQYVDAIRSALTTGGDHTDDWPTQAQKDRISKLYTGNRKIQNVACESSISRTVFYESREESPAVKKPTDVKMGLYMSNATDRAAISSSDGVAAITSTVEGLRVMPSGTTPKIRVQIPDGIDVYDITYLKIRMKKNPTSGGGFLYWSSDISGGVDDDKKLFFNAGLDDGTEFVDYYAPVSTNMNWTGKVEALDIMLGQISDLTTPFVIESIELLQDKDITAKDKVVIDGRVQDLKDGYVEKDGTLMLPMREVLYMAGAEEILAYQIDNAYTVKYNGKVAHIKENNRKASVDGQDIFLSKEPYRISEIINDTVYIPLDFAEAIMTDKEFAWNAQERVLTITSFEEEEEEIGREIIYSIEYDDETSVSNPVGFSSVTVADGKAKMVTSSSDPNFAANVSLDASAIKVIRFKFNTPSAQRFKFYFITNKESNWNEAKGSATITTSPGNNVVLFDTSMISTWKDTITRFRIDPAQASGAEITMDQVTFYGDELAPATSDGLVVDMSSCISVSNNAYEWKFNKNTHLDGWNLSKEWGNVKTEGGKLSAVITGNRPTLVNRNDINLDTQFVESIVIKYANKTNSRKLKVYFLTDKDKTINEQKCFELDVNPMSEGTDEYTINVKDNANWKGTLKKLVIAPQERISGSIEIDNIGLLIKEEKLQ